VDLLNQWQLIACLNGETPPFAARSDALFAALRDFELTYSRLRRIPAQHGTLLVPALAAQQGMETIAATIIGRENLARFDHLPLLQRVPSAPELKPGTANPCCGIESIDYPDAWELGCRYVETLPCGSPQALPTTRFWRRSIEVNAASRNRSSMAGRHTGCGWRSAFPCCLHGLAAVAAFQFPDASRAFQGPGTRYHPGQ
jgi:hypothetical protein